MSDTSGLSSPEPFAFYDPAGSCWRTSQLTFDLDLSESSLILPTWGSMRAGRLYEHPMSVLLTSEPDSLSLLPTPAAQEPGGTSENFLRRKNRDGHQRTVPTHLSLVAKLLPTPTANDHTGGGNEEMRDGGPGLRGISRLLPTPISSYRGDRSETSRRKGGGKELRAIRKLLPTPTTQDAANTAGPAQFERNSDPLNVVATKLLPTPTSQDAKYAAFNEKEAKRNPNTMWAFQHGVITNQQSDVGKPSLDTPHPDQLTLEGV